MASPVTCGPGKVISEILTPSGDSTVTLPCFWDPSDITIEKHKHHVSLIDCVQHLVSATWVSGRSTSHQVYALPLTFSKVEVADEDGAILGHGDATGAKAAGELVEDAGVEDVGGALGEAEQPVGHHLRHVAASIRISRDDQRMKH